MSHEVRIDRVPTAQPQPSPSPLMHPSHLGLPPMAPVPHGVLPVLPTALSMHSPHLLAQMSHFLMSLREQHQKLRMVQEATSNSKNLEDVDKESNTSRSSTTPITSPTSATVPTKNINNNNVTTEQPLDLSMSSKQKPLPLGSSAIASAKFIKNEPIINNNHHTVTEDENRNLIDVVSMDSPEGGEDHIRDDRDQDDILDEDDDDMLDDRHDINDMDDNHSDIVGTGTPPSGSIQNELLAAHSAILSRFQNVPSSNIPPEALEQVQRTLKQMLAHASAKQSRAQAAQTSSGKMER